MRDRFGTAGNVFFAHWQITINGPVRLYCGMTGAKLFQKLHFEWNQLLSPACQHRNDAHLHRATSPGSVVIGRISGCSASVRLNSISWLPGLNASQCGVMTSGVTCTSGTRFFTKDMNAPENEASNCAFLKGGPL